MFKSILPKSVKIVEKFKIFLCIALAVILVGLAFIIFKGMNIGVDFSGGAKIEIDFDSFANDAESSELIKAELKKIIETDNDCKISGDIQVSPSSEGSTYEITLRYYHGHDLSAEEESEFVTFIQGAEDGLSGDIAEGLGKLFEDNAKLKSLGASIEVENVKAYTVGATASGSLIRSAAIALAVAIVVMLVYIVIRFTLASALAAVCALVHDVLIMVAATAIFGIPVNSTFIAAVITIVGYSINATIIIFDRVREERKSASNSNESDEYVANLSIAATLNRTILTTLTTLVMVVALAIFSVPAIREFIIPIIFGLLAGSYSSVFLASGFWATFRKLGKKISNGKLKKNAYDGSQSK